MPIFRDVKKNDSNKTLNLNKEKKTELKVSEKAKVPKKEIAQEYEQKSSEPGKYSGVINFALAGLVLVFIVNFINIGNQLFGAANAIEANANLAVKSFVEGGKDAIDSNYGGAVSNFETASSAFEQAKEDLWFLESKINTRDDIGSSAVLVIDAGEHLAKGASNFSQGFSALQEIPELFLEKNALKNEEVEGDSLTEKLKFALELFDLAHVDIVQAKELLDKAKPSVMPTKFQENFELIKDKLDDLIVLLNELRARVPAIMSMLGDRYPHRYMVLFQNNTEARPTGGFIGSFMIIDVNDGYITKADFHDVMILMVNLMNISLHQRKLQSLQLIGA